MIERREVHVTASSEQDALDQMKSWAYVGWSPIRTSPVGSGVYSITLERLPRGSTKGFCE